MYSSHLRPLTIAALIGLLLCPRVAADENLHPYGAPKDCSSTPSHLVLVRQGYELLYDDLNGIAKCATYHLWRIGAVGQHADDCPPRSDAFSIDEETQSRVRTDFLTVANLSGTYDRGHLAPAYGIGSRLGVDAERGTYLMSNMVAQHGSLNSGKWLRLEQKEADEYANGYDDLWIIDGPIYDRRVPSMNAGTVVPTKLFKIMLIKRDARPVIQAFIFPNRALGGSKLEEYLATVDEIEAATQLDFFPNMKKRTQERLESARPTHLWIVSE